MTASSLGDLQQLLLLTAALILERKQNGVAACSWYVTLKRCNNFPKFQLDLFRSHVSEFQLSTTSANVSGYMCKVQPTLRKWLLVMKCLKKPYSYSSYYACVYMCLVYFHLAFSSNLFTSLLSIVAESGSKENSFRTLMYSLSSCSNASSS